MPEQTHRQNRYGIYGTGGLHPQIQIAIVFLTDLINRNLHGQYVLYLLTNISGF